MNLITAYKLLNNYRCFEKGCATVALKCILKGAVGSGSLPFLDEAQSVLELRKEKPQMCTFRTLLSTEPLWILIKQQWTNTRPFGMHCTRLHFCRTTFLKMLYRGFLWQPCCMQGTMRMFCIRRKNFPMMGKRICCFCHAKPLYVQCMYVTVKGTCWESVTCSEWCA